MGLSSLYSLALLLMQVTAVSLLALAIIRLGRRRPALRYLVSLCALLCLLFSPLLSVLARQAGTLRVRLPLSFGSLSSDSPSPAPRPIAAGAATLVIAEAGSPAIVGRGAPGPPSLPTGRLDPVLCLLLIWAAGSFFHLVRLLRGWQDAAGILQSVRPLTDSTPPSGGWETLLAQVTAALGAPALPPLVISDRAPMPLVVGVCRPQVTLPAGLAASLSGTQLREVLIHECAHVREHHPIGGLVQRLAALLFWPHPLVHVLIRELARAREEVCDNFVLRSHSAPGYARTLLTVAQATPFPRHCPATLGLLPARWRLEDRIAGLLDPRRSRATQVSRWLIGPIGTALLGAGMAAAAVRPAPAPVSTGRAPVNPGARAPLGAAPDSAVPDPVLSSSPDAPLPSAPTDATPEERANRTIGGRTGAAPGPLPVAPPSGKAAPKTTNPKRTDRTIRSWPPVAESAPVKAAGPRGADHPFRYTPGDAAPAPASLNPVGTDGTRNRRLGLRKPSEGAIGESAGPAPGDRTPSAFGPGSRPPRQCGSPDVGQLPPLPDADKACRPFVIPGGRSHSPVPLHAAPASVPVDGPSNLSALEAAPTPVPVDIPANPSLANTLPVPVAGTGGGRTLR